MAEPRVDWVAVANTLAAARVWLGTPQPAGAVCSHLGDSNYVGGGMRIAVAPNTTARRVPGGRIERAALSTAVIYATLSTLHYGEHDEFTPPPLTAADVNRLRTNLVAIFGEVLDEWNGAGASTVSFVVPCQSDAAEAVVRYHEGCPHHDGDVFCNGWQNSASTKGCTFMADAFKAHQPPSWVPVIEEPAPCPDPITARPRSRAGG